MDSRNSRKRRKRSNCTTRTAPQERRIPDSEKRKPYRKTEARVARSANVPKRKAIQVNKGKWSGGWEKKREKIEPKDATFPIVSTESVMLTATIDALEGRDVAVVDIIGAYLSADMDKKVHVVFRGTLV